MYIRNNVRLKVVWGFARRTVWLVTGYSILVTAGYELLGWQFLGIPFLPISTIGIGVVFYLGFKNNGSYDRLWEARIIWGGLVNNSRIFANQCLNFVAAEPGSDEVRTLVYRHLAFVNALRLHLRRQADWEQLAPFLSADEFAQVSTAQNPPNKLGQLQQRELEHLQRDERIDLFRYLEMHQTLKDFTADQGRCERIKNTPFPRQYAYISTLFTWIFVLLLPFGLVGEFAKLGQAQGWTAVPFSVLIAWVVVTMDLVGHHSENPFENQLNDVPMTALCRSIEIDVKEMLGEQPLPARIQPMDDVLL